jgi:hypothetical protein
MPSCRLVRDGDESGIYAIIDSKNQLTGNLIDSIMQPGIALVLKWYFSFTALWSKCFVYSRQHQGCVGTVHVVGGRR